MDFSKLDRRDLADFLVADYSAYGFPTPEETARLRLEKLLELDVPIDSEIIPTPIQDLYLASIYDGPRDTFYTEYDILHLGEDQVSQFADIFGFAPSTLNLQHNLQNDRERILRIISHLGLIYHQAEGLLEPTILQNLCSTLPLDDLNNLRKSYGLEKLNCIIPVNDPDEKISSINGLTDQTYWLWNKIFYYGTHYAINSAIDEDCPEALRAIAENSDVQDVFKTDPETYGFSYLELAIIEQKLKVAHFLIEHGTTRGVDLNGIYKRYSRFSGNTIRSNSLHWAVNTGSLDLVKHLVEKGADVTLPENRDLLLKVLDQIRPFEYVQEYEEIAKYLIEQGVDVNYSDEHRDSPLNIIIIKFSRYGYKSKNKCELIQAMVEAGADPNKKDPDGNFIVQSPLEYKNKELVECLIGLDNFDVNMMDESGSTVLLELIMATSEDVDYMDLIQDVIARGADINLGTYTPLDVAILRYSRDSQEEPNDYLLQVIELLLKNEADPKLVREEVIENSDDVILDLLAEYS